jgi:hypothetical protein
MIMEKDKKWHGIDKSNSISLFEYGLLIRWIPKEQSWQVIYASPDEHNKYCFSWITENELDEIFISGWGEDSVQGFLSWCGTTWEEWIESPFCDRIYEVKEYFGAMNLFGSNYGGDGIKEICKRLHIKYDKDFETA